MSDTNTLLVTKTFHQTERESGLFHVTLKMVFAQVVKTSVANNLFFGLNYKCFQLDLTT